MSKREHIPFSATVSVRGTHDLSISGHSLHSYDVCMILEPQICNQPAGKPRGEESQTAHSHC